MSATEIVFWEHVVLTLAVLPILLRAGSALRRLRPVDWVAVIAVGGGASVTATILFTKALTSAINAGGDLTTPLLLQKLQPVFAVIFAYFVLGERVRPRYFWFLAAALLGSYLLVLDDPARCCRRTPRRRCWRSPPRCCGRSDRAGQVPR